jgi:CHAT domain-containing protein
VAVKVGARSAFASLWAIADESTASLVAEFYRTCLQPGRQPRRGAASGQLTLLADERYRHPFFWGPFLLIGNWL